jgi:hydrogenase maturation protease
MARKVLIVAYGNPLRCDDGIAWRAADALEGKFSEDEVEILRLHQLAPELAETASHFKWVIFVDAAAPSAGQGEPGEIRFEKLTQEDSNATRFSHVVSPQTIVVLAARLFDADVKAFLATVIGANFDHGDSFSPAVSDALPILISKIESFVQSTLRADSLPHGEPKL